MVYIADLLLTILQAVLGIAVLAAFVWLLVRLLGRVDRKVDESPPGSEPADRTDDTDRPVT